MTSSSAKRVALGICFGRRLSVLKPRNNINNDVKRFENCNRLGCSVRHMSTKCTDDDSIKSSQSPQTTSSSNGPRKLKEPKRVPSLPPNTNGRKSFKVRLKKDIDPETLTENNMAQDDAKLEVDESKNDTCVHLGTFSSELKSVVARHIKCTSQDTASSPEKPYSSLRNSPARRPVAGGRSPRKISSSSSPPLGSSRTHIKDKMMIAPRRNGPSPALSSTRSKTTVRSSNSANNTPLKLKPTSTSTASHPRSTRRTARDTGNPPVYGKSANATRPECHYQDPWQNNSMPPSWDQDQEPASRNVWDDSYSWGYGAGCSDGPGQWDYYSHGQWDAELPCNVCQSSSSYSQMDGFADQQDFEDRYMDMRMDIDHMTYEELLALGEKIGTVATALTDEALTKCIMKGIFELPEDISKTVSHGDSNVKCSICQEEYVDGEEVGRLLCHHFYHFDCVHEWFRLKNWCPICKSSAMPPWQKE